MYARVIAGLAAPALLALSLAGCGSDEQPGSPAGAAPALTAPPSATAPASATPSGNATPTGAPTPTAPAFDLCAVLPMVYVEGVFTGAAGAKEATDGTCAVYTKSGKAKIVVRRLAGSQATSANESAEWLAPLRPVGDSNWAAGVKPASDGNGILLMNKTNSHACTARTSDTNNEVRSADKQEYYHILAIICYDALK